MFEMLTGGRAEVDPRSVGCHVRGCAGMRYRLQDGEALGRTKMAGRHLESRDTVCSDCGAQSALTIQVRGSR